MSRRILLLPGFSCDGDCLAELHQAFTAKWPDRPTVVADFSRDETLEEMATNVRELVAEAPSILVGLSMGGWVAQVVAANEVWVATRGGELRGFVTLLHRADRTILDDLWLEPDEIGRGTGRLLFDHARTRAAAAGARTLEWEAEPYAAGFYERMGGVVVGMVDSPLGRPLPLMRIPVGASWAPC